MGSGSGNAVITNAESIDGKTLYELQVGGLVLFAVEQGEPRWQAGEAVSFDLDQRYLSAPACGIEPLELQNRIPGSFVKHKEAGEKGKKTFRFYMEAAGQQVSAPDSLSSKLFAIKDTKIFRTPLEYIFDASAVTLQEGTCEDRSAYNGTVTQVLDYGTVRYAKVDLGGHALIAPYTGEVGSSVSAAIESSGISVKDRVLDIIIV